MSYNCNHLNTNTPKLVSIARRVLTRVKVITMAILDYTSKDQIRFWEKVNKNGTVQSHCPELGQCWEWTSDIAITNGYGRFYLNGKTVKAHRLSWNMAYGDIPDRLFVLHKCDNRKCVNPKHLFLGTHKDNMDDRERKCRNNPPRGELHANCKITDKQVIEIRERYAKGGVFQWQLAAEYNISHGHVSEIVRFVDRKIVK